jgi:hypothetical protein
MPKNRRIGIIPRMAKKKSLVSHVGGAVKRGKIIRNPIKVEYETLETKKKKKAK